MCINRGSSKERAKKKRGRKKKKSEISHSKKQQKGKDNPRSTRKTDNTRQIRERQRGEGVGQSMGRGGCRERTDRQLGVRKQEKQDRDRRGQSNHSSFAFVS